MPWHACCVLLCKVHRVRSGGRAFVPCLVLFVSCDPDPDPDPEPDAFKQVRSGLEAIYCLRVHGRS